MLLLLAISSRNANRSRAESLGDPGEDEPSSLTLRFMLLGERDVSSVGATVSTGEQPFSGSLMMFEKAKPALPSFAEFQESYNERSQVQRLFWLLLCRCWPQTSHRAPVSGQRCSSNREGNYFGSGETTFSNSLGIIGIWLSILLSSAGTIALKLII